MTPVQQTLYIITVNYINTLIMLLQPFYLLKYRGRKPVLAFWLGSVVCFAFFCFTKWCLLLGIVPRLALDFGYFYLLICYLFRDSRKRKLVVLIEVFLLTGISEILTILLLEIMGPVDYTVLTEYGDIAMRGMIFTNMTAFTLNIYLVALWKWIVDKYRPRGLLLYLLAPLYQFVLLLLFFERADIFDAKTALLGVSMLVMGIVVNMVMMYLLQEMESKMNVEEKLSELYRQRQYEQEYYQVAGLHMEQMREIRHDFINQIQTALVLIQNGSGQERAKALLQESYQQLADTRLNHYCGDPVINALISVKASKAEKNGIDFRVECRMGAWNNVEEIDLCSLFGNLLDNAIEACLRIPEGEIRRLVLKADEKGGYRIIRTENTYSQKEQRDMFFLRTSKKDQLNHGFGMKLIERICRKYGGELRTQVTDDVVYVSAFLSDLDMRDGKDFDL